MAQRKREKSAAEVTASPVRLSALLRRPITMRDSRRENRMSKAAAKRNSIHRSRQED